MKPAGQGSRWSWRRLTSYLMVLFAGAVLFTGAMVFLKPSGQVARRTGWALLGLGKEQWEAVHITTSLGFVLAGLAHLWLNWRPLAGYLKGLRRGPLVRAGELLCALGLLAGLWAGTLSGVGPISSLLSWQVRVKASWGREEPPLEVDPATGAGGDAPPGLAGGRRGGGQGQHGGGATGQGRGAGLGQTTLAELCGQRGIELEAALRILAARGVEAAAGDSLKALGERLGLHPRDVAGLLGG